MKMLIGSNNLHKAQEFQEIFRKELPGAIELVTPHDIFNQKIVIDETGSTFRDNALLKAKGFYEKSGLPCFSDDSGLEVRCLYGAPGINSARYAGQNASDEDNRKKVLNKLKECQVDEYLCQFRSVICYYDGENQYFAEGICKGKLILEERGDLGFGYDPIFIPHGYDKTFAEMEPDLKNQLSHRRKAIDKLIKYFEILL
jgi:XTP/dITP diphosphohydrolase